MARTAEVQRKTAETEITVKVDLDGSGEGAISTGIGFFDHMLQQLVKHSLLNLDIQAKGDLEVDAHHTVEDVGICVGSAIKQALGKKEGIRRFASKTVPMDEALVLTSIDLSGRGSLGFDLPIDQEMIGEFPTVLVEEFFKSLIMNAGITAHIRKLAGENPHHIVEAAFKSFAQSFQEAVSISERVKGTPSTKGTL
ncbi:MAG: imidazoleglycerol-phosphate dehydratase HisB [Armatimonadota bacterium]|nr:imidazoleglycerol-phosphate dehydratase HisB [Armatimonadota bacterium]